MAGKSPTIFEKRRPTAGQFRAAAEHRFDDAICLLNSGDNARGNGAMYMAGFVLECLLKALLLDRYPNLGKAVDPAKLSRKDKIVLDLLYGHDLDAMLAVMPDVGRKLGMLTTPSGRPLLQQLRGICQQWTIHARYSTRTAKIEDARQFVDVVKEVKKWLKEL